MSKKKNGFNFIVEMDENDPFFNDLDEDIKIFSPNAKETFLNVEKIINEFILNLDKYRNNIDIFIGEILKKEDNNINKLALLNDLKKFLDDFLKKEGLNKNHWNDHLIFEANKEIDEFICNEAVEKYNGSIIKPTKDFVLSRYNMLKKMRNKIIPIYIDLYSKSVTSTPSEINTNNKQKKKKGFGFKLNYIPMNDNPKFIEYQKYSDLDELHSFLTENKYIEKIDKRIFYKFFKDEYEYIEDHKIKWISTEYMLAKFIRNLNKQKNISVNKYNYWYIIDEIFVNDKNEAIKGSKIRDNNYVPKKGKNKKLMDELDNFFKPPENDTEKKEKILTN